MRSWPCLAWISAAVRAGISAWLMWSTVTLTPTCFPHSCTNGSNHSSAAGTKWLHIRIFRSPESLRVGSVNVVDGVGTPGADCGWTVCSRIRIPRALHPPSLAPATCKNRRRDMPYMFIARSSSLKGAIYPGVGAVHETRFHLGCGPDLATVGSDDVRATLRRRLPDSSGESSVAEVLGSGVGDQVVAGVVIARSRRRVRVVVPAIGRGS